ncbi:MAG: tRNA (cytidine(34)-2'-O)-methyltransferase [Solirubrobacterales bacterium]
MDLPRLALYQPDIPQNAGALLRLAACFGMAMDVIEPCGFLWDERRMRRAGMDYAERVAVTRHCSWSAFDTTRRKESRRLVLLTTRGGERLDRFSFARGDVIMVGRESAGVPDEVAQAAEARVVIPMVAGERSLNVAMAAAMAAWEAMRQIGGIE